MNFKLELAKAIAKALPISETEILLSIEIPPNPEMGDFAFPCFKAAKPLKKAPAAIAADAASAIELPDFIEGVSTKGPYLNFFLNKRTFISEVLTEALAAGKSFGKSTEGEGRSIVIDYSSPNIAKPFHVGHLRSTVIGNALYKIYSFLGYKCFGINHLGDWGTQFGKLISAYKYWSSEALVEEKGIEELTRIYVKFHEEAEKNPALDDEARAWFVKMESGDKEALSLWKKFYDISLVEFERVYKMLGVSFDYYTGESFYNDKMVPVVEELKEIGLLVESDGARMVDLEEFKLPPCLIVRSDGGTLYATRDITAALYRAKEYNFYKALYVTGMDQALHFKQWFHVIKKMGYSWWDELYHIPFGLVSLKEGKLSTRTGRVVLMEDLLNEATAETLKIIEEKNPDLENKEAVAAEVGIGAVIFNDLYNTRIKDVVFSWERMLSFEGETGPYVQYTHARCASLLRKAGGQKESYNTDNLSDEASLAAAKLLDGFGAKISEAAAKNEPYILARHIMALAQAFNKFYHDNAVLSCEDEAVRESRLGLTAAVKNTLAIGLSLIGVKAPEAM